MHGRTSSGSEFWEHIQNCMELPNFKFCKADPEIWMRPVVKADGSEYWEYVLLYCDDLLVINENVESILHNEICKYFELKE